MSRMWFLTALLAVGACGSDRDDRPVSFSYIHAAIVLPNCATSRCHSTLAKAGGFDMQGRDSAYHVFTAIAEHQDILLLIRGDINDFYRMPPDQPLPDADIELVQKWYDEGLKDN